MKERDMKKHKCPKCGCRIFKVSYSSDGFVNICCNECGEIALFTVMPISNIPFDKATKHELDLDKE